MIATTCRVKFCLDGAEESTVVHEISL